MLKKNPDMVTGKKKQIKTKTKPLQKKEKGRNGLALNNKISSATRASREKRQGQWPKAPHIERNAGLCLHAPGQETKNCRP